MGIYAFVAQALATVVVGYFIRNAFRKRERAFLRSVAILVLGDIGHSPRMMYHAESFAESGFQTYLVGFGGSTPIPSLKRLNVQTLYLAETPSDLKKLPFLVFAPLKVAFQVATILYTLLIGIPHPPEYIMVQNPPSIPTLALVWFVCKIRGSKLIIDWHNLGYSILALRLGNEHIFVKVAKRFERFFGRCANIHLFVTKAMRDFLVKEWDLQGIKAVLHDRPPSNFKRAEAFETHDLFNMLKPSLTSRSLTSFFPATTSPQSTPFTHIAPPHPSAHEVALDHEIADSFISVSSPSSNFPELRDDRPALLVSSTSWTPDEDFSILLDALRQYERRAREVNEGLARPTTADSGKIGKLPKVMMIVTGKGPLKSKYMSEVAHLEKDEAWRWVRCRSLWLEAEEYPVLLGSADLGICLHSSSSALDLPMKVVDMFGCGLPVCALDFKCLDELLKDGQNGFAFRTSSELATQLERLLHDFPHAPLLNDLRASFTRNMSRNPHHRLHAFGTHGANEEWCTWSENWDRVLKPLILTDVDRDQALAR